MNLKKTVGNTILAGCAAIAGFGCAGTKVHFADAPMERLDLSKVHDVTGSASGFQLLLFIPINVNSRHQRAYEELQDRARGDFLTDIKIQDSWTYAFVGTIYRTTLTATAYPERDKKVASVSQPASARAPRPETSQERAPASPESEQPARKAITNDDVVAMIKAGLPETTIIASIKHGPSAFDTSPQMLINLRNQGATAGILEAMMAQQQQAPAPRSQEEAPQPAVAPPSQERVSQGGSANDRECVRNFTSEGSFWTGRNFKTHQFITNVTQTVAVGRAMRYLAGDGWHISSTDKELGIISASQAVIMGQGETAPLNVSIEPVTNGVNVVVAFSIAGGMSTPRDAVVNELCAIIEAIGRQ